MNFVLTKKPFTMKIRVLLFFVKFLVNQFAHTKLALNKSMHASDNEQGINKLQPWIMEIRPLSNSMLNIHNPIGL